ncbi:hypothetical protein [Methylotenera sp. 1P/1]|uniref:hypothetical protein n=1 Tax=Methylotenera sp. 1P/1 TaxID=1131551 RepID=UPI0012FAD4E6|nr:hypothetical protein [Methylotenera sp. 1P/1]
MQNSHPRQIWLALIAALITEVGVCSILENVVFIFANTIHIAINWLASGGSPNWSGTSYVSDSTSAQLLIIVRAMGFAVAGFIGSWFAPRRSRLSLFVLILLSIVATFVDQLPPAYIEIWYVTAPFGILLGVGLLWWFEREA